MPRRSVVLARDRGLHRRRGGPDVPGQAIPDAQLSRLRALSRRPGYAALLRHVDARTDLPEATRAAIRDRVAPDAAGPESAAHALDVVLRRVASALTLVETACAHLLRVLEGGEERRTGRARDGHPESPARVGRRRRRLLRR